MREQPPTSRWRDYLKSAAHIRDDPGRARVLYLSNAMVRWFKDRTKPPPVEEIRKVLRCRPRPTVFFGAIAVADLCRFGRDDIAMTLFNQVSIAAAAEILSYAPRESTPLTARSIIRLALHHRSDTVRRDAIWKAYWYCPDHFDALMKDNPPKRNAYERDLIKECRNLIRDGYHAEFRANTWSWHYSYRCDERSLRSADVPKYVIDSIGHDKALKYVRKYDKKHAIVPWDEIVEGA